MNEAPTPTQALSPRRKQTLTLRHQLESEAFKAQVAKALPRHLTPDRFIRVACTAIMRTPKLGQCDQVSFFNALLTLSQLGLEPDGRRAHLIPFENRKRGVTECQLIVDYKGLAELAMRSGTVSYLHADTICENDSFRYNKGQIIEHVIDFRKPRGSAYAVYAICRFKDGTEKAEVMTTDEVEAVRSRSRAGQNGPWVTDWSEMAKKTVFRRLSKWLVLSPEYNKALESDDDAIDIAPAKAPSIADFSPAQLTPPAEEEDDIPMEWPAAPAEAPPVQAENEQQVNGDKPTVQDELRLALASDGFTLAEMCAWATTAGHFDGTTIIEWNQIPEKVCAKLLDGRTYAAMLRGLNARKGV